MRGVLLRASQDITTSEAKMLYNSLTFEIILEPIIASCAP